MSQGSRSVRARTGVGSALVCLTICASLSVDNLLGFSGWHFLPPGAASSFAIVGVVSGTASLIVSSILRRVAQICTAAGAVVFLSTLSPAFGGATSPLPSVMLQAAAPVGFALGAALLSRRGGIVAERVLAAGTVLLALAWLVGAFVPISLPAFLAVQTLTFVTAGARIGYRSLASLGRGLQKLWSSAAIR